MKQTVHPTKLFIKNAWKTFKNHWKFLIPAGIVTFIIFAVIESILPQGNIDQGNIIVNILGIVVYIIITTIMSLGWAKNATHIVRKNESSWVHFQTTPKMWSKYIATNIIYFLATLPFIIFIIIGLSNLVLSFWFNTTSNVVFVSIMIGIGIIGLIWLSIRMMFLSFIIVDHPEMKPVALFKKTFNFTKGHIAKIILLGLFQLFVFIVGTIALVVGLFVAVPVIYLSKVHLYEHLKSLQ